MKKIIVTLFLILLSLGLPRAQAEVSLSFFYDSLADDGDWFEADDYGYCWQPTNVSEDWSPYTDGYWTYTDAGWTWVSYESFGWATYHYGRWANIRGRGWVWVPGYEWGPAWVSWRSNDDYVGWAPLPARAVVSVGVSIGRDVDYDYDIGPSYYHFTSCRRFGSPSLRQVIVNRSENITIINQTTNITNISYRGDVVYNGGPDYDRINSRCERPIERLKLDRVSRIDDRRDYRFNRRENGRLTVVAPAVVPVNERVRPRNIKASLGKVETDHGWSGVRDANLAQRTRDKIRDENKRHDRGPVARNGSVAQALRSEARQREVASVPAQRANVRPANQPDRKVDAGKTDNRATRPAERPVVAKPFVRKPENKDQTSAKESDRRVVAKPVTPEGQVQDSSKRQNRDKDEAELRQEALRRRQQTAERENLVRQKANREKNDASQQQENREARQRAEAAAARKSQQNAERAQNERRTDAAEAQERRARQERQAALQQREQREQQQQRQAVQVQQQRRQAEQRPAAQRPNQPRPAPVARPQVQQSQKRAPQPTPTDSRKKKKNNKDDDNR